MCLGTADQIKDVALILCGAITKTLHECPGLPWPPTADDLDVNLADQLPNELITFLGPILCDSTGAAKHSETTQRLIFSMAQDLCCAVTKGEWKFPKHILLCSTVRHLFRSKQLVTILHKLGHSVAKVVDESSTYLTPQIICGISRISYRMG